MLLVMRQADSAVSSRAQQVCAECMGMLGAVDPARLNVLLQPPKGEVLQH